MSHPNTPAFMAKVSTKENKTKGLVQAGGNPKSLASGGAKAVASKKKHL